MPITRHRLWQLAVDAVLIAAAWYLAFQLRFDFEVPRYYQTMLKRRSSSWSRSSWRCS